MAFIASQVFFVLLSITSLSSANLSSEYNHFAVLDDAENIKLYWTIDKSTDSVSFALEAATNGWVGFGFSSGSGMMKGADIVIGWVKDGEAHLTDRYADGEYLPAIDEHNDYHLIDGKEEDGTTILKFKRKIETCDPRDRKLKEGTTKVIFALNDEDPESEMSIKKHTFRGARSIMLLSAQENSNPPDPSWKSFDILKRNVSVPAKHTTYHYSVFKIPELAQKNHIVRFDPIIQPGNEGFVHHFNVMACDKNFPEHMLNRSGDSNDHANMPAEILGCFWHGVFVSGWAVGGGPFIYPSHIGIPIGTDYLGTHFVLEIHYDNPDKNPDIVDSSGVRYFYTPTLREYDAGVYTVGADVSPWMMIPPKQKAWITKGYCSKRCSEKFLMNSSLPEKGIKVFSSSQHTHLAGRAIWTKHVRNGVELPEIGRDDNYDFNFQDAHILKDEVHIKPGDELIQFCQYDTMNRTRPTFGGVATTDEMCLNFMVYYPIIPKLPLYCCDFDIKAGVELLDKYYPEIAKNATRFENPIKQSTKPWTLAMTEDYKEMIERSDSVFSIDCGRKNITTFRDFIDEKNLHTKAKITTPLQPPSDTCDAANIDRGQLCCSVTWVLLSLGVWLL